MTQKREINYKTPIYLQLREVIRKKIEDGEYLPATAIPSENELAEIYGINRLTVRSAIHALVSEGRLKRVQGKGVFVVGDKTQSELETLGGFMHTVRGKNVKSSTKILMKAQRPAGTKYAHIIGICKDDPLNYIKRLDFADDEPISLGEIYFRGSIIPNFEELDLTVFDVYDVFAFYDIMLKYARQTLDIVRIEPNDARMLNIEHGQAVLLLQNIGYDEKWKIIGYSRYYVRGDKCEFAVNLQ